MRWMIVRGRRLRVRGVGAQVYRLDRRRWGGRHRGFPVGSVGIGGNRALLGLLEWVSVLMQLL
jgi:hypothetical protein